MKDCIKERKKERKIIFNNFSERKIIFKKERNIDKK